MDDRPRPGDLSRHLINDFPSYYGYFATKTFLWHRQIIFNHDNMLRSYPGADGLKTGYTEASGHNLVTSAVRSGVRLVGVVLGAASNGERDIHMASLLDQGFERLDVPASRGTDPNRRRSDDADLNGSRGGGNPPGLHVAVPYADTDMVDPDRQLPNSTGGARRRRRRPAGRRRWGGSGGARERRAKSRLAGSGHWTDRIRRPGGLRWPCPSQGCLFCHPSGHRRRRQPLINSSHS